MVRESQTRFKRVVVLPFRGPKVRNTRVLIVFVFRFEDKKRESPMTSLYLSFGLENTGIMVAGMFDVKV